MHFPLTVQCAACSANLRINKKEYVGRHVNCPKCTAPVFVSAPDSSSEIESSSPATNQAISTGKCNLPIGSLTQEQDDSVDQIGATFEFGSDSGDQLFADFSESSPIPLGDDRQKDLGENSTVPVRSPAVSHKSKSPSQKGRKRKTGKKKKRTSPPTWVFQSILAIGIISLVGLVTLPVILSKDSTGHSQVIPFQVHIGLLMVIGAGLVTFGAWTETLPIGRGWRERLIIRFVGEKAVMRTYFVLGVVGICLGIAAIVWGVVLFF